MLFVKKKTKKKNGTEFWREEGHDLGGFRHCTQGGFLVRVDRTVDIV